MNGEQETQLERRHKTHSPGSSLNLSPHQKNSLMSIEYFQFNEDQYTASMGLKNDGFRVEELASSLNSSTTHYRQKSTELCTSPTSENKYDEADGESSKDLITQFELCSN